MSNNNLQKVITLFQYMYRNTDEEHPVSMARILKDMEEQYGLSLSDETVKAYFRAIREFTDLDVVQTQRGRYAKHYLTGRLFQKEELRVLIDAVNSSMLINEKNSKSINKRLLSLASAAEEKTIVKNALGISAAKSLTNNTWVKISAIEEAINKNCQVSFFYSRWNSEKKLEKGKEHKVSPFFFLWGCDRYYLYCYENGKTKTFRVDKIEKITLCEDKREHLELGRRFSEKQINDYVAQRIDMFDGDVKEFTLLIPEKVIGAYIDRFGKDNITVLGHQEEGLVITFKAAESDLLFGWILGVGVRKILSPESFKERGKEILQKSSQIL